MELIFATNNRHKIQEVKRLLGGQYELKTLQEAGVEEDLPEPFLTFPENARSKADFVFQKKRMNCFAEDSGLVVPALNGAPGVHSARYAGLAHDDELNNQKLIREIQNIPTPTAYYVAVICLILNQQTFYFEGKCEGHLIHQYRGANGFGYDPLFIPDGFGKTFGELNPAVKNKISHRAKAIGELTSFLNGKLLSE